MTDTELNDAMAEALGYAVYKPVITNGYGIQEYQHYWIRACDRCDPKPFCTDRNLLIEVWNEIKARGLTAAYFIEFGKFWYVMRCAQATPWDCLTAEARDHVRVALQVLDRSERRDRFTRG